MVHLHLHPHLHAKPPDLPPSPCTFAASIHRMMVAIIRARNDADEEPMPDDFDPKPFTPRPKMEKSKEKPSATGASTPPDDSGKPSSSRPTLAQPQAVPRATHNEEGLLLSSSLRPGGSQFQYVQFQEKASKYKAIVPHNGKRHSLGPGVYGSDIDAARAVKQFLESLETGAAPMSRGEKRTHRFNTDLDAKLAALNLSSQKEARHHVASADDPTCKWCGKTVHRFYALKFAESLCPELSSSVDKRGSLTRAGNLSKTRTQTLQNDVEVHNKQATANGMHVVTNIDNPSCKKCKASTTKKNLRRWMIQRCPATKPSRTKSSSQ